MAEHVRVDRRHPHPGRGGKGPESAGGGVPVHPDTATVEQDRPAGPVADGGVKGATDRGRQRDEDGLVALADDPQNAVAVFLAEVGDVRSGRFEDPQAVQPEQAHEREVVPDRRLPGCGEQRFELEVGQPEGR